MSLSHIEGFAQMLMPREPTLFICPYCNTKDYTEVDFVYGGGTCFASFVSGVLCFPFGFFIPYFLTTFKDALHYCPKCSRQVGINKPCWFYKIFNKWNTHTRTLCSRQHLLNTTERKPLRPVSVKRISSSYSAQKMTRITDHPQGTTSESQLLRVFSKRKFQSNWVYLW